MVTLSAQASQRMLFPIAVFGEPSAEGGAMTVRFAVGLMMIGTFLAGPAAAQPVPPDMTPVEATAWSAIIAG